MPVLGIDTGGTFTDLVLAEPESIRIHKISSTPRNPAEAFLKGVSVLCRTLLPDEITHGSTVATNAMLERRGANVALVTTAGFESILEIGRQTRPSLYDFNVEKLPPLVSRQNIFGVNERSLYDGTVHKQPVPSEIGEIAERILRGGYDSIALCFLHSYANPTNECFAAEILEKTGIPVSASHQVLPEYREYERFSTTSVNAYVSPGMDKYLHSVESNLPSSVQLRIMQSNGGSISAARARHESVQTILSGPAAGVVGAFEVARTAGYDRAITLDMGGTSTDVSLCDGKISVRTQSVIADCPVGIPMIDIQTVGAGGGSVAWRDSAGSLHVGPRSAGADPGPVCYGLGSRELTVTDANLCLGRMLSDRFLGGAMRLDVERAQQCLIEFSKLLGLAPEEAAEGIIRIANTTMERAIRVISVERGHDPRRFSLVAFGGAGPMHACELARALSIPNIVIPHNAGVLSAFGLLMADVKKDFSQTVLLKAADVTVEDLDRLFHPLEQQANEVLTSEGFSPERVRLDRFLDFRYVGQSYEVMIPAAKDFVFAFHSEHNRRYGYSNQKWPVELVNIRLCARGAVNRPRLAPAEEIDKIPEEAVLGAGQMVFGGKRFDSVIYDRQKLQPGNRFSGPAVVIELSTTTVVPPDFQAKVDLYGNIIMTSY